MTVEECQSRMSHREYATRMAYEVENEPHRTEWYLMQVAYEIRRIGHLLSKDDLKPIGRFKIRLERSQVVPLTPEEKLERSKAFWLGSLGVKKRKDRPDGR